MNRHLLLAGLLSLNLALFAVPAKRGYKTIQQPDGTSLSLQLAGDEFLHYHETLDGQIVLLDNDGYYKYATIQEGQITISNIVAHNPSERNKEERNQIQQLSEQTNTLSANKLRTNLTVKKQSSIAKTSAYPTSGEVRGLVLLVEFKDERFKVSSPLTTFQKHINEENYSAYDATGSVRDYFMDQSSKKFTPVFDVCGPITLSNNMAYYGANDRYNNDLRPATMVKEACELAAANHNIDFSNYDLDDDGIVDLVYVIYAGYSEAYGANSNTIWPHAWDIAGEGLTLKLNGKSIRKYACSSELLGVTGTNLDGIGTFCHEFSHCLGLPDLYDTAYSGKNFGMGEWDIMDAGSYNNYGKTPPGYSAFEKASVGWLALTELDNTQKIELKELHASNQAYVAYSDVNRNEYFIFENRQQSKWDTYLPATGLLITHVDYLKSAWTNNIVNNEIGHQRVSLVPADNELMIYSDNAYSAYVASLYGDPYPGTTGNTSFTDTSIPAANLYTGGKLGKPVTNIKHTNKIVTFDFMMGYIAAPQILQATDITHSGFTANWKAVENADSYTLLISEVKGGELIISEDFAKMTKGSISSPDGSDISSSLDKYMNEPGWAGMKIYQAGGICKLGSNSGFGSLTSPQIDFSNNEAITVYYTLQGKTAMSKGIIISLNTDAAGNNASSKVEMGVMANATRQCVVFNNLPQKGYLKLQPSLICYLDDLKIYTGDMSEQEPNISTRAAELPLRIENLTSTTYSVTGLNPQTTYAYQVLAAKEGSLSAWSPTVHVQTLLDTSIDSNLNNDKIYTDKNNIIVHAEEGTIVSIYQINGISVFSGVVYQEPLTINCEKGIYIIKCNNKTQKIIITE